MVDIVKERIKGDHLDDRITAQQADAQDLREFDVCALHPLRVLRLEPLSSLRGLEYAEGSAWWVDRACRWGSWQVRKSAHGQCPPYTIQFTGCSARLLRSWAVPVI